MTTQSQCPCDGGYACPIHAQHAIGPVGPNAVRWDVIGGCLSGTPYYAMRGMSRRDAEAWAREHGSGFVAVAENVMTNMVAIAGQASAVNGGQASADLQGQIGHSYNGQTYAIQGPMGPEREVIPTASALFAALIESDDALSTEVTLRAEGDAGKRERIIDVMYSRNAALRARAERMHEYLTKK